MADIRVKDLNEATVPGADYYLLTDSATDGVKKVKTTNVIAKADIGLGNVDNTSDATKNAASATLTNKTISGASNTLSIREVDLSISDVTTGNVSTLAHGFAPKLPNDAAKFLDGTGAYTVPSGAIIPTGATTVRPIADWMADDLYIEDFGGDGTGNISFDNTPAFNAALAAGNGVRFRAGGQYYFNTAPNEISKDFRISGAPNSTHQGIGTGSDPTTQGTRIYRNYVEASSTRGLFSWLMGYIYVGNLYFVSTATASGGSMISVTPAVAGNPITVGNIDNITITSENAAGGHNYSIYCDGTLPPSGLRTLFLHNVVCFGAAIRAVYLKCVVHFNWTGGAIALAGGTDGGLEITSNSSSLASQENIVCIDYIDGDITLDYCKDTTFNIGVIAGGVTNTANVSSIVGMGHVMGAIGTSWGNSAWQSGDRAVMGGGSANGNVATSYSITNGNSGNAAGSYLILNNDTNGGSLQVASSTNTDTLSQNRLSLNSGSLLDGIALNAAGAKAIRFYNNGTLSGSFSATGAFSANGTNTNDSASAGSIGEYKSSTVLAGSAVSLTTNTQANITSLSLTAGDWDVWGNVIFSAGGSTVTTQAICGINTTSATLPTAPAGGAYGFWVGTVTGQAPGVVAGQTRISIASTTTVYLIGYAVFTTSTLAGYGFLGARRVR